MPSSATCLQFAQEQIKALEADDMYAFDQILAARRTILDSLVDVRAQVAADPALQTLATRIQECDRSAQRLLYRKVGGIMRSLSELQQAQDGATRLLQGRASPVAPLFEFQPDSLTLYGSAILTVSHRIFFRLPVSNQTNRRAV